MDKRMEHEMETRVDVRFIWFLRLILLTSDEQRLKESTPKRKVLRDHYLLEDYMGTIPYSSGVLYSWVWRLF